MAIIFDPTFSFETGYPDYFHLGTVLTYNPWSEGDIRSQTVDTDTIYMNALKLFAQEGQTVEPFTDKTFSSLNNIGHLKWDELKEITGTTTDNPVELFRLKIGVNEDGSSTLWLCCRAEFTSESSTYQTITYQMHVDFYHEDVHGSGYYQTAYSMSCTLEKRTEIEQSMFFGAQLCSLPGREPGPENCLMFISMQKAHGTFDPRFTLTPYSPAIYEFPAYDGSGILTARYLIAFDLGLMSIRMSYGSTWNEVSPEAGPESGPGGMGQDGDDPNFDDSSDTIDIPTVPEIGVSNVGFVNVYKTGLRSLQNMGVELFPDLQYTAPSPITASDTKEAIVNGVNQFMAFLANIPSFFDQIVANTLINYIIDCHVIPVTPSTGSSAENIKVGYKTLTATGYKVSSDYKDVDCGTINLGEYYANFADFSATSAKLFLPFVGFVPARPEWFYRDSLNVTYRFNIIDGSFMAYVRSTGKYVNNSNSGPTIVGQYSGNACVHLPITGVTSSNMVSGLVGAGAGAVASAGSGSIAGVATSALNAASVHGDMPQSNAYTASGSFLSGRRPFLMIERAVSSYSKTYQKEIGIPSNISRKLGTVHGFAMIGDIHLDGITATNQEKAELEKLLSQGVIL